MHRAGIFEETILRAGNRSGRARRRKHAQGYRDAAALRPTGQVVRNSLACASKGIRLRNGLGRHFHVSLVSIVETPIPAGSSIVAGRAARWGTLFADISLYEPTPRQTCARIT